MRLQSLEILRVAPPPPGWGGRYWTLVKLATACGITGWGEVYAATVGPRAMDGVIADVFSRHMEGEDPENLELMFRRAYSAGFSQRPDPTVTGAFAGLEIACWDILGKARGRPVWAMLGGRTNARLRAYSYLYPAPGSDVAGFWVDPDRNAEEAARLVAEGFTAVKFDPAGPYTIRGGHEPAASDISRSVAFCRAIRAAVGDRADLLFGTHGQFCVAGAIRLGQAIEPYGPLWYEEPVPPDDPLALAEVARAVRVPVAVGERLAGRAEFATVLRTGGARILQPALGRMGGIWEARKLAALAEGFAAQIAPHHYCGPIEWVANLHLATAIPNLLMVETVGRAGSFHLALIGDRVAFEGGFVCPPEGPGLGVEIDEALARAHPVSGDRLHLEMQEAPCDYARGNRFEGGAPAEA